MTFTTITFVKKDHIAYITLNRPEAKNAVNLPMAQEMADCCSEINGDDEVYVTLITGAGEAFCSGSELSFEELSLYHTTASIAALNCPVIAAINGEAVGEGLELALSCDFRLASETARFALPQLREGQIPSDGGTQRLPRIIGKGKALELILTGETLNADEAYNIGLVNYVVEGEKVAAEAEALAKNLASKGPIALKFCKEAVNKGLELTLEQGLRLEADLYFLIHTTADRTEGVTAFLHKRPPQFKGK